MAQSQHSLFISVSLSEVSLEKHMLSLVILTFLAGCAEVYWPSLQEGCPRSQGEGLFLYPCPFASPAVILPHPMLVLAPGGNQDFQ